MLTDDEVQAAIDAGNAECRRRHTGIRGQMMMPGYDPYVCVARAVEAAVYEKAARECEGAAEMTEADILQIARAKGDETDTGFIFNKEGPWSVLAFARALLADRDEREAALRAEVEALRNLLHRAGNALVCDGEVMSESDDEWTRSHACGRCDDYVDRGWPIRTEIRAALARAKDAEAR